MAAKRSKKQRLTTDEMFDELQDLKVEIELEIFAPEKDDPETIPRKNAIVVDDFSFHRNLIDDLRPDPDAIEDDLVVNAAVYARYNHVLVRAERFLARAEHELKKTRARAFRVVSDRVYKDPDITPRQQTVDFIKSLLDVTPSVMILTEIRDDCQEAVSTLKSALKSLEMKHFNCLAISRAREGEARMIGSSPLSGASKSSMEEDETKRGRRSNR